MSKYKKKEVAFILCPILTLFSVLCRQLPRQSTFCKSYPQYEVDAVTVCVSLAGPMVWYQKFEYAVGHWLHKSAEHVFGCVLCSPGCFSLFRAAALMDNNVMKKYTVKASRARHHIQYDQGN